MEHVDLIVHPVHVAKVQALVDIRLLEEHHVDEGDEEVGCAVLAEGVSVVGPVEDPLDEDHRDEVSEQEQEEHNLWHKLEDDLVVLPLGHFVPQAQGDTKGHVDDAEYERYLHLVGVEETNFV